MEFKFRPLYLWRKEPHTHTDVLGGRKIDSAFESRSIFVIIESKTGGKSFILLLTESLNVFLITTFSLKTSRFQQTKATRGPFQYLKLGCLLET
jgi:hypothetical protein